MGQVRRRSLSASFTFPLPMPSPCSYTHHKLAEARRFVIVAGIWRGSIKPAPRLDSEVNGRQLHAASWCGTIGTAFPIRVGEGRGLPWPGFHVGNSGVSCLSVWWLTPPTAGVRQRHQQGGDCGRPGEPGEEDQTDRHYGVHDESLGPHLRGLRLKLRAGKSPWARDTPCLLG